MKFVVYRVIFLFASVNAQAMELWCGNDSRLKPPPELVASSNAKSTKSQFGKPPAQPPTKAQLKASNKRIKDQKEARKAKTINAPIKESDNQTTE